MSQAKTSFLHRLFSWPVFFLLLLFACLFACLLGIGQIHAAKYSDCKLTFRSLVAAGLPHIVIQVPTMNTSYSTCLARREGKLITLLKKRGILNLCVCMHVYVSVYIDVCIHLVKGLNILEQKLDNNSLPTQPQFIHSINQYLSFSRFS